MDGDGHDKTHSILAELAALVSSFVGGKKRSPWDFLTWRKRGKPSKPAPKELDAQIRQRIRDLNKRNGAE